MGRYNQGHRTNKHIPGPAPCIYQGPTNKNQNTVSAPRVSETKATRFENHPEHFWQLPS